MTRSRFGRSAIAGLATATLLLGAVVVSTLAQGASEDHPVVGRWNVRAEPGGAVWAFQPSGMLVASGPGEIVSTGAWSAAAGEGEFDARLDVAVSGQVLEVLGTVAPDGSATALFVTASEATRPDDWTPWPAESRLVAPRFGMTADETPQPSEPALDCLRPQWVEGAPDWDRCDDGLTDPSA